MCNDAPESTNHFLSQLSALAAIFATNVVSVPCDPPFFWTTLPSALEPLYRELYGFLKKFTLIFPFLLHK